jgi:hypothetical protein
MIFLSQNQRCYRLDWIFPESNTMCETQHAFGKMGFQQSQAGKIEYVFINE